MTPLASKLALGTVQWGTAYGISNKAGKTPSEEVDRMLDEARAAGVVLLDTAAAYGVAEEVLGNSDIQGFRVTTKTPRLESNAAGISAQLVQSLDRSLKRLRADSVYGLLVHNVDDLLTPDGQQVLDVMQQLRQSGKVQKIGVSVYDSAQARAVLEITTPDIMQVPLNVLDQRMLADGTLELLRCRGVEIHARSVFLQGLLLMPLEDVPSYFEPVIPLLRSWHAACAEQRVTPVQGALAFVRDLPAVAYCLVGVQDMTQLVQCLSDFSFPRGFDGTGLASNDAAFVNPSNWRVS